MRRDGLAKDYSYLTPLERFQLLMAASFRGDEGEQDRVAYSAKRLVLSVPDHAPYAIAMMEMVLLTFIEILERVALYNQLLETVYDALDLYDVKEPEKAKQVCERTHSPKKKQPTWLRYWDTSLASAYVLKTHSQGWKLFCERLSIPGYKAWGDFTEATGGNALWNWLKPSPSRPKSSRPGPSDRNPALSSPTIQPNSPRKESQRESKRDLITACSGGAATGRPFEWGHPGRLTIL